MNLFRFIGAVFIISGTAIGGGMLALPIVAIQLGFIPTITLFTLVCGISCISALLLTKINMIAGPGMTLLEMTTKILDKPGQIIANSSLVLLSYALLSAYLTGTMLFLKQYESLQIIENYSIFLITLLVVILLVAGIKVIDQLNKSLFLVMIVCFFLAVSGLLPAVHYTDVYHISDNKAILWVAVLPVLYTAFGFHGSIPVLTKYIGNHPIAIRNIMIIGSLIPLLLYIIWIIASIGVIPIDQAMHLSQNPSLSVLLKLLNALSNQPSYFIFILNLFYGLAIITSLLGVGLGLFDHLATVFQIKSHHIFSRIKIAILAVTPSFLVSFFYPKAFIAALGYAAIPLAFISILLPLAMMQRLKKQQYLFRYEGLYWICGVMIVLIALAQVAVTWKWIPSVS
ncbi:MAG: hypothetical protein HAW62_01085 [Endozoicomonadaceae bacterium]|nr:hypothetical protein [Endozoicomonadaceae bacterium]